MAYLKAVTVAVVLAVLATTGAGAQNFSCQDFGRTVLSPAHPGPDDPIGWFTLSGITGVPAGWTTLARTLVLPGNFIDIDVVVTADVASFPGYEPLQPFPHAGVFGPLPVGHYLVASRVRTFDLATQTSTLQCTGALEGITVSAQPGATATAPVIEFYNASLDHYFMTQDPDEIHNLDSGVVAGWTRTGHSFLAYLPAQSDARGGAVARFYGVPSAGLDSHLFTNNADEIFEIVNGRLRGAWVYETADAFELPKINTNTGACPPGTRPVYRLWNGRQDSNHRYTTELSVKQQMIALGYIPEGYGHDSAFLCAL